MAHRVETPKSKLQTSTRLQNCAAIPVLVMYRRGVNSDPKPPIIPPQEPVRLERYERDAPPHPKGRFWLHPKSGLLILAVDWFFFGPEIMTGEAAAIITSPLAFLVTTAGVFWIQRKRNGDSFRAAMFKALLGGIAAGIPTSIAGTMLGTTVLVLSGLSSWNQRRDDK
ncbi:MAG TPA: hypothetical protein VK530_01745 [Candidatus Acidoferrum sp.]|nr:hypothetical protein [Candidatus Acidoferrum sp.]